MGVTVVDSNWKDEVTEESKNSDVEDIRIPDRVHGEDRDVLAPSTMLGFKRLSLTAMDPPRSILSNVTGFVTRGEQASGSLVRITLPVNTSRFLDLARRMMVDQQVVTQSYNMCFLSGVRKPHTY